MLHQSADEISGFLRQTIRRTLRIEDILSVLLQREVEMHPRPVQVIPGLGHEGCMQSVAPGYGLYCHPEGLYIIGGLDPFIEHEVYLMLGGRLLVL